MLAERRARRAGGGEPIPPHRPEEAEAAAHELERLLAERERELRRLEQREYAEQQLRVDAEETASRLRRRHRAELDRLQRRVEESHTALHTAAARAEQQRAQVEQRRLEAEQRCAALRTRLSALSAGALRLQTGIHTLEATAATLRAEIERERDAAQTRLDELQQAHAAATARLGELETAHAAATARVEELEGAHAAATARVGELETAHAAATARVEELEGAHAASTARAGELEEAHAASTARIRELEDVRARIATSVSSPATPPPAHREEMADALAAAVQRLRARAAARGLAPIEEPAEDEPPAGGLAGGEPTAGGLGIGGPPAGGLAGGESTAAEVGGEPPAGKSQAEEPGAEEPSTVEARAGERPASGVGEESSVEEPSTGEPAVEEPSEEVPAAPFVEVVPRVLSAPTQRPSWLAPAIRHVAERRDARLAAELIAELLPAQRLVVERPLTYDCKIAERGEPWRAHIADGHAEVGPLAAGATRRADFTLEGRAADFAELAAGGTGRRLPGLRIHGRRRSVRALRRARRTPLALWDLAAAGIDVWPGLLLLALAEAIDPVWTAGWRCTLAFEIEPFAPSSERAGAPAGGGQPEAGEGCGRSETGYAERQGERDGDGVSRRGEGDGGGVSRRGEGDGFQIGCDSRLRTRAGANSVAKNTLYVHIRDGASLAVSTATQEPPRATVRLRERAFVCAFAGAPLSAGERVLVQGDPAPLACLLAWGDRAQRGGG